MNKVIREMVEITENKWVRVAIGVNLAVLTLRGGLELLKLALGA